MNANLSSKEHFLIHYVLGNLIEARKNQSDNIVTVDYHITEDELKALSELLIVLTDLEA